MSKFSFVDKKHIQNNKFFLDQDESHHLINVLRLKLDSNIWLTDGEGGTYYCKVENFTDKNIVEGCVLDSYANQNELNYHIHLGLPIIKKSRMKIAIEKSVESGIKELTPLSLDRSIKSNIVLNDFNLSLSKLHFLINFFSILYSWAKESISLSLFL